MLNNKKMIFLTTSYIDAHGRAKNSRLPVGRGFTPAATRSRRCRTVLFSLLQGRTMFARNKGNAAQNGRSRTYLASEIKPSLRDSKTLAFNACHACWQALQRAKEHFSTTFFYKKSKKCRTNPSTSLVIFPIICYNIIYYYIHAENRVPKFIFRSKYTLFLSIKFIHQEV